MKADSARRYFNRELSWLFFNSRVLEEAQNPNLPVLERIRFLSISASNLDEFYMVRVAGLRTQQLAGMSAPSFDGLELYRQIEKITKRVGKITRKQEQCWRQLRDELESEKISILKVDTLNAAQMKVLKAEYKHNILPLLSPLAVDPAHPFPFLPNLGFGMALTLLEKGSNVPMFGLIPVPAHVPRFMCLNQTGKRRDYVLIEDVLTYFAPDLFADFDLGETGMFRITRDSDIAVDEEAEDLVRHFEFLLKKRRRGRVIRLELNSGISTDMREFLIESFECWDENIQDVSNFLGMTDLAGLLKAAPAHLLFPQFTARFPERIREYDGNCFAAIAAKDILVHHPYEEFEVVIQFLKQAATDPQVVAIKQTLYRTSDDSPIVRELINAAEAGKNVTALVELKARFDEATNLRWARDLERAGVQVVYGFVDYKTHAKVSLVIRKEGDKLRSYTHLGTGNYHAQNAKVYTDLALFTADKIMGEDVGKLFNFMTSYSKPRSMKKLIIAPLGLRARLNELINAEIAHVQAGRPGSIWAKMNALVDMQIIEKLYEASNAGVNINLIIRGICCLRPGVKGMSENIQVKSIIGRFLEHSRIICFGDGHPMPSDQAKVFFSSADWMPRNLNHRIETLVPVESRAVHTQVLHQIMMANLLDNVNSWELKATGRYIRCHTELEGGEFSAHEYFMENPSLSGRGQALATSAPQNLGMEYRDHE
ncbi:MAG: RNA degradosome polyphosphate kinase [Litorimonas sp.]